MRKVRITKILRKLNCSVRISYHFVTYLPREVDGRGISEIYFFIYKKKIDCEVFRDSRS